MVLVVSPTHRCMSVSVSHGHSLIHHVGTCETMLPIRGDLRGILARDISGAHVRAMAAATSSRQGAKVDRHQWSMTMRDTGRTITRKFVIVGPKYPQKMSCSHAKLGGCQASPLRPAKEESGSLKVCDCLRGPPSLNSL
ncbi:uncharacterized protein An15g02720 [Aspergillus niger]|uniref:Contig An15c0120, genomic contig n=2 Tax=Aspergillus niger TaxID=5061 RepID=A2R552_ASPNC|nr:uncharacterized protein An15g02720 [Aspergillus niger]CAK42347.1 unnamed protein product [Aspergillus niger]